MKSAAALFFCFGVFFSSFTLAASSFKKLPTLIRSYFPVGVEFATTDTYTAAFRVPTSKGYRLKTAADINPIEKLPPKQQDCWYTILSGGNDCLAVPATRMQNLQDTDLLYAARAMSHDYGMRVARDWIEQALPAQDDSHGQMESRVVQATKNPNLIFPDSLKALSAQEKARIGIYFIPGFRFVGGLAGPLLESLSGKATELGFQSQVLPVTSGDSAQVNSQIIFEQLGQLASNVDHIILVSLSKGSNDLSYFLIHDMKFLPMETQKKLDAIISLSGAVRSVYVARWVINTPGATTSFLRSHVLSVMPPDERTLDGLVSMAKDPWEQVDYSSLPGRDHITWINFSMIPSSPLGFLPKESYFSFFTYFALAGDHNVGPYDGLIETAASVLPPSTGYRQWVVRARGDHALVDNHFLDGTPVSSNYDPKDPEKCKNAGADVVDAFLRAIPASILSARHSAFL